VKKVGVLISGRGSNLQALIEAGRSASLGGEIALVVSNVPDAAGLDRAREAGIPTLTLPHKGRAREAHDQEIVDGLRGAGVELVCLAGYLRLVSRVLLEAFPARVLNIHPSLLPAFPGLKAQRQALDHGAKVSGATVHFVTAGLDSGPILLQEAVSVLDSDTEGSLAARILEVEHRLYPRAVSLVLGNRCHLVGRRVLTEGA
jgi:phosphoribosylglycinamide formyltransferase-1